MDEELREAQRQKWQRAQQAKAAASSSSSAPAASTTPGDAEQKSASADGSSSSAPAPRAEPAASSSGKSAAASGSGSAAGTTAAPADSDAPRTVRRVHILPVKDDAGNAAALANSGQTRLQLLAPELRRKRDSKEPIKTGLYIRSSDIQFVVVKSEPDEGLLSPETDYFVEGDPISRFEKVQFICLWDFESGSTSQDPSVLFNEYISPYFRSISDSGEDMGSVVYVGETLKIFNLDFQVMAAQPTPPDIGIIDASTMVFVDWDGTPEFEKIHIIPFQDTLPHVNIGEYQYDIFTDYLKPYLTKNKHLRFGVNDQFTYQGVQFKVVCCEPNGPARIGRNTTIYCEGVLHPSLRNLLPPELLEQLWHLPPGLQSLLLDTEALAGGYEERLIEVQEMLSRRRGLSSQAINMVEKFRWGDAGSAVQTQTQCMICLSDFAETEEVRKLPCNHVFHMPCIDEWLNRCTDCPICKANVDRAVRNY
mmetsp:Transcript_41927/g.91442  ORF Transcript_41927/g.91442 Transcript_41927/m.91442 type:complete len:478 (-) Transcript_41927:191-1624(-)